MAFCYCNLPHLCLSRWISSRQISLRDVILRHSDTFFLGSFLGREKERREEAVRSMTNTVYLSPHPGSLLQNISPPDSAGWVTDERKISRRNLIPEKREKFEVMWAPHSFPTFLLKSGRETDWEQGQIEKE